MAEVVSNRGLENSTGSRHSKTIEELASLLEEKESIVRVTAEIGQNLLEQNKQLEETVSSLEEQLRERNAYIEQLLRQTETFRSSTQESETQRNNFEQEIQTLNRKYEELRILATKAEAESVSTLEELQKETDKNKKLAIELTESNSQKDKLRQQVKSLEEQIQTQKQQIELLNQKEVETRKLHQNAVLERDSSRNLLHDISEKLSLSEQKVVALQNKPVPVRRTESSIEIEELKQTISEMQRENGIWAHNFEELLKMHQQHEEEYSYSLTHYEERIHFLENALRKTIKDEASLAGLLNNKENDSQLEVKPPERRKSDIQIKSSIFDEIKEEITKELSASRSQVEVPELPTFEGDLSSSENFFYLTACAVKISIAMERSKFGFTNDNTARSSTSLPELYQQAIKEHRPFHEWYTWLRTQFLRASKESMNENNLKRPQIAKPTVNKSPAKLSKIEMLKNTFGFGNRSADVNRSPNK